MDLPHIEALEKLFGVVLSGFGAIRLLEPWQKKRLANATAYELTTLARADIDVQKIRLEGKKELQDFEARLFLPATTEVLAEIVPESDNLPLLLTRARERVKYQEAKRQLNVELIATEAAKELEGLQVSSEPVDEDWTARFFEGAKDISSEEMQKLWGKILAGEVKKPGSFSLRCIETVRNLSKREAELFASFIPYVVMGRYILHSIGGFHSPPREILQTAVQLADAGLAIADRHLVFAPPFLPDEPTIILMSDLAISVAMEPETRVVQFPAYLLSKVGIELMGLFRQPADRAYARLLVEELRRQKSQVETYRITDVDGELGVIEGIDIFPPFTDGESGASR